MRATLEFELPEDQYAFTMASKGQDLYSVLWELDQYLRSVVWYGVDKDKIWVSSAAYIRDKLYYILEARNLSLDMVS